MIRALPHLWATVIVVLLLMPGSAITVEPFFHADKWAHLGVFLIWIVLWRRCRPQVEAWRVALAVGLMAFGSELCHLLIPALHRSGEILDLMADLIGAGLGWIVALRLPGPRATESVSEAIDNRP